MQSTGPDYYIEYFHRVSLDNSDMEKLGRENVSFLAAILFAANEMFVYQKILATYINRPSQRYEEMKVLSFIHQFTIMRTSSAKIMEFIKLYEDQCKIWNRKHLEEEINEMNDFTERLGPIKESEFFKFTKEIRDTIINHYIVSEISKNLEYLSDKADYSLQLHWEQGNSFFPIGEEIVFAGYINRYFRDSEEGTLEQKSDLMRRWIDWILRAIKWINDVVQAFAKFIVLKKLSGKRVKKNALFLDPDLVADIRNFRSPLILRDRNKPT